MTFPSLITRAELSGVDGIRGNAICVDELLDLYNKSSQILSFIPKYIALVKQIRLVEDIPDQASSSPAPRRMEELWAECSPRQSSWECMLTP